MSKAFAKSIEVMSDPDGLASMYQKYSPASTSDEELKELYTRMESGDQEAAIRIQQKIADMEWGNGGRLMMMISLDPLS